MPASSGVTIRGLRDLNKAFAQADKDARRFVRAAEREIAEPVRKAAEQLAVTEISHIGPAWSQMRIGVTQKVIYVAPKKRGTRDASLRRPNLAGLLMNKAMQPALDQNADRIEAAIEHALDKVADRFNR